MLLSATLGYGRPGSLHAAVLDLGPSASAHRGGDRLGRARRRRPRCAGQVTFAAACGGYGPTAGRKKLNASSAWTPLFNVTTSRSPSKALSHASPKAAVVWIVVLALSPKTGTARRKSVMPVFTGARQYTPVPIFVSDRTPNGDW